MPFRIQPLSSPIRHADGIAIRLNNRFRHDRYLFLVLVKAIVRACHAGAFNRLPDEHGYPFREFVQFCYMVGAPYHKEWHDAHARSYDYGVTQFLNALQRLCAQRGYYLRVRWAN